MARLAYLTDSRAEYCDERVRVCLCVCLFVCLPTNSVKALKARDRFNSFKNT